MELRQLNYFIAVAEERHFGRAAKRLHVAQPQLSQQIRHLEEELGVRLLERTTRRVDISAAGQELLDRGRDIVNEVESLKADVFHVGDGASGVLRVGFAGPATYGFMPKVVRHVKQGLPSLSLSLHGEMLASAMENGLRNRTLDAAVLVPPVSSTDIESTVVAREKLVIALPEESPLATGQPVAISALEGLPFVMYPPDSVMYRLVDEMCRHGGFQPRIGQVEEQTSILLSLVAAGGGVAVVPDTVRSFRLDGVTYAPLEASPQSHIAVAWRRDNRSSLLRNFVRLMGDLGESESQ